uniref:Uncharacterized protein n=1 Tax=Octopus bimaculoides TaxID=37653 RepID=A0A0L8G809_OCTBM
MTTLTGSCTTVVSFISNSLYIISIIPITAASRETGIVWYNCVCRRIISDSR